MPTATSYFSTSLSRSSKQAGSGSAERYEIPSRFRKLESAAVGVGVRAEVNDTVADDDHAGIAHLLLDRLEGFRTEVHRHVSRIRFPVMDAQLLGGGQGFRPVGPPLGSVRPRSE